MAHVYAVTGTSEVDLDIYDIINDTSFPAHSLAVTPVVVLDSNGPRFG